MSETLTNTRRKRCSECGELKHEVLGQQRLCEECERDKDYCRICDWWYSGYGDGCRHIQWCNEASLLAGCGSDHIDADDHKDSFLVVLGKLAPLEDVRFSWDGTTHHAIHEPLLPKMLTLIEQNNFWTFWHGPIIGGPPNLAFKYERDFGTHKSVLELIDISGSAQEDWGEEAIDAMQLGMCWLTSLDGKTTDANALTAKRIREFLLAAPAPPVNQ